MYKLKGGLPYNTDCFSYRQGTIQASYAVMRQLLFFILSNFVSDINKIILVIFIFIFLPPPTLIFGKKAVNQVLIKIRLYGNLDLKNSNIYNVVFLEARHHVYKVPTEQSRPRP